MINDYSTASNCTNFNPENILDYASAMSNFKSMFPDIDSTIIEQILRKHYGDVTNTINELLQISADAEASFGMTATSSTTVCTENVDLSKLKTIAQQQTEQNVRKPIQQQDLCADDEKIALLMQNREFMQYLQSDENFMREISGGASYSRRHRGRSWRYARPNYSYEAFPPAYIPPSTPIMVMSKTGTWHQHAPIARDQWRHYRYLNDCSNDINVYDSQSSDRNNFRHYDNSSSKNYSIKESPAALPNGPLVDFSEGSVPNGPFIDYSNPQSGSKNWTEKLKSHLPLVGKSSKSNALQTDSDSSKRVDYDTEFSQRLRNMSKNSKTLFLTLAKKFSHSKKAAGFEHLPPHCSTDYETTYNYDNDSIHEHMPASSVNLSHNEKRRRSFSSIR